MTGETVLKDHAISSKRVHVERIKGLAKTYKILKEPLNVTETKLASEITFVCFMLCNFNTCNIPETAYTYMNTTSRHIYMITDLLLF